jgi:hypothetical protein
MQFYKLVGNDLDQYVDKTRAESSFSVLPHNTLRHRLSMITSTRNCPPIGRMLRYDEPWYVDAARRLAASPERLECR